MDDIQEWARIVAAYRDVLMEAMPGPSSRHLVDQLTIDWQRLMIARVMNAPDITNLHLAPGAETAHVISNFLVEAMNRHPNANLS